MTKNVFCPTFFLWLFEHYGEPLFVVMTTVVCILIDPTTFDKTIMVRHIYNRHIFGQKYGQETSDGMSNVSINCDSIR